MRILVTGSRDWDPPMLNMALHRAVGRGDPQNAVIVHGDCPTGADAMADRWAQNNGATVERHPADWKTHGKRAGYLRNTHMVALGADICLAFIKDGSRGASMTADMADRAGIIVARYTA